MRTFSFWRSAACCADCVAYGRELNAKETSDGFLSHYIFLSENINPRVHL